MQSTHTSTNAQRELEEWNVVKLREIENALILLYQKDSRFPANGKNLVYHMMSDCFQCLSKNAIYLTIPQGIENLKNLVSEKLLGISDELLGKTQQQDSFNVKLERWAEAYKLLESKNTPHQTKKKVAAQKSKKNVAVPTTLTSQEVEDDLGIAFNQPKPTKPKDVEIIQNNLLITFTKPRKHDIPAEREMRKVQISFDEAFARTLDKYYRNDATQNHGKNESDVQRKQREDDLLNRAFMETYEHFPNRYSLFKPADKNSKPMTSLDNITITNNHFKTPKKT